MTFEDYLKNGGDREEKLVVIYKVTPKKLTEGYKGILDALSSGNRILVKQTAKAFPDLDNALYNWDNGKIRSELDKAGADFV